MASRLCDLTPGMNAVKKTKSLSLPEIERQLLERLDHSQVNVCVWGVCVCGVCVCVCVCGCVCVCVWREVERNK